MSSVVNETANLSTPIPIQLVENLEVTPKPISRRVSQVSSRRPSNQLSRNLSQTAVSNAALSAAPAVSNPIASSQSVTALSQHSNGPLSPTKSLLSGRLSIANASLSANDQGITRSVDENNAVSRIAQDLLEFQNTRRPSNLSNAAKSNTAKSNFSNHSQTNFLSSVEQTILRSDNPIQINEEEEIEVNGERGLWANKDEVVNWRGVVPITEYAINQDTNPDIITKKSQQQLEYIQELAIRYLRPPTPPAPGEIIITQEPNKVTPPAPPLIIRQQPARPDTPEPLVIREAPPAPPAQVGRKVITISGKRIPPPPRKVVIERLAPLPSKPQAVLVERWLPYAEVKRRVIFNKPTQADPIVVKPRNVIVQWEAPEVNVKREYKYLGVIRANPVEYVERYGDSLTHSNELPDFVLDIKTPEGLVLAAEHKPNDLHELEGDIQALKLVNLENEGLGQYKDYLKRLGITRSRTSSAVSGLSRSLSAAVVPSSPLSVPAAQPSIISSRQASRPVSRQPSIANSSAPVNVSTVFHSASFVARPPSIASPKTPSVHGSRLGSRAQSVVSQRSRVSSIQQPPLSVTAIAQSLEAELQQVETDQAVSGSVPVSTLEEAPVDVPPAESVPVASIPVFQVSPRQTPIALSQVAPPSASRTPSLRPSSRTVTGVSIPVSIQPSQPTQSRTSALRPSYSTSSIKPPTSFSSSENGSISTLIEKIFRSIDRNNNGRISVEDAEKILLRLNSRLGRRYGEDDVKALFTALDINNDGSLDLDEFKRAFLNITN